MDIVKEGMNKDFVPSEIHYRSWERLTKLLDNVPSVDIFDLNKTCYLISDASLYGSGACNIQTDSLGNPSVCHGPVKYLQVFFLSQIISN